MTKIKIAKIVSLEEHKEIVRNNAERFQKNIQNLDNIKTGEEDVEILIIRLNGSTEKHSLKKSFF